VLDSILAYIDPGSGSLMIQAVIASIVAVPFVFRAQLARILGRFRRGAAVKADQGSTGSDAA
jgi:hypothetical protein